MCRSLGRRCISRRYHNSHSRRRLLVSKTAMNVIMLEMVRLYPEVLFQAVSLGHCRTAFNGYRCEKDPQDGAEVVVRLVGDREVDTIVGMEKRGSLKRDFGSMRRGKCGRCHGRRNSRSSSQYGIVKEYSLRSYVQGIVRLLYTSILHAIHFLVSHTSCQS
jgi:hypothetical protein